MSGAKHTDQEKTFAAFGFMGLKAAKTFEMNSEWGIFIKYHLCTCYELNRDSLVAQMVESLPAVLETQVQSLGQEHPLEKELATHSSTLAWKIPWMEEPDRLQSMGLQRVRHDWATSLHFT